MPWPRFFHKKESPVESNPIENETLRVIQEHLGTILSIDAGVDPLKDSVIPPDEVENHIRHFFAVVDERINWIAQSDAEDGNHTFTAQDCEDFKVMMRKLYQVATTEDFISAIEAGVQAALEVAGNDRRAIYVYGENYMTGSRKLFHQDVKLALSHPSSGNQSLTSSGKDQPKAVLICDDVAHSGNQLRTAMRQMRGNYPGARIIISVGMITTRAQENLVSFNDSNWVLLFTKKASSLKDLIQQIPNHQKQARIKQLAVRFASSQADDIASYLEATHIITPSKLPDDVSNGQLSHVSNLYGLPVSFTPQKPHLSVPMYPASH